MKLLFTFGEASFPAVAASGLDLLVPHLARAQSSQTVASYTFSGATGLPVATAPGVNGSEFVRDDSADTFYDNTAGNPPVDVNSNGWTTASVPDPSPYYTFTVTPGPSLDEAEAAASADGKKHVFRVCPRTTPESLFRSRWPRAIRPPRASCPPSCRSCSRRPSRSAASPRWITIRGTATPTSAR